MLLAAGLAAAAPSAAAAHEGWGIVVDAHGRVYVADIPANTVWRISRDGRMEPVVRHVHSHALGIDADGGVFGTHVHLTEPIRGVWHLDASGRLSDAIAATRGFALDLQSFLRAGDGTVYSASVHQHPAPPGGRELYLLRWSPAGIVDTVAGGHVGHDDGTGRAARFESIDGMAWLPDGSIVLADGASLRRVTAGGEVTTLGRGLTERRWDQDLMGVAVGLAGAIYAADFTRRTVLRMRGDAVEPLYHPHWYWAPTGVAVDPTGTYVLEHPRAPLGVLGDLRVGPYLRVRRIGPGEESMVLATRWGEYSQRVALAALGVVGLVALARGRRRSRTARMASPARAGPLPTEASVRWSGRLG